MALGSSGSGTIGRAGFNFPLLDTFVASLSFFPPSSIFLLLSLADMRLAIPCQLPMPVRSSSMMSLCMAPRVSRGPSGGFRDLARGKLSYNGMSAQGHPSREARGPIPVQAAAGEIDGGPDEQCSLLFVRMDNASHPLHTVLSIETMAYPGLLRTIAWTLNGLGVRVQNLQMKQLDDGFAEQTFYITDLNGIKLSDTLAENIRESLNDFIETCMPSSKKEGVEEWTCQNVIISNTAHEQYTELVINGEPRKPGFLLRVTTVIGAIGATIHEAIIQSDESFAPLSECSKGHDFVKNGRVLRFLLSEGGQKLSPGRVDSVVFMLDLVAGRGHQPTNLSLSFCDCK